MTNNSVMVSIIIPHYNHSKALNKCLDSIYRQTYHDFEIIIVDDGSSEKEKMELQNLEQFHSTNHGTGQSHSLDYGTVEIGVICAEHGGANAARNRGAREARGEYFLFCDADIIMQPEMLSEMVQTLKKNLDVAYAYASFKFGWKLFRLWPFDDKKLRENNYMHTTSMLRKEWFPGFDEQLKRFQDWDLWLTILGKGGRGVWIPKVLFTVLPHKGGMSKWLPTFFYKIPWQKIGTMPKFMEEYNTARKVILEKHKLTS